MNYTRVQIIHCEVRYVTDEKVQQVPNDNRLRVVELSQTAVQIVLNPPAPSKWGPLYCFKQACHADWRDGWHCSSQNWVMSRLIRQLQTNESGFAISAINKYMLGSRYSQCAIIIIIVLKSNIQ